MSNLLVNTDLLVYAIDEDSQFYERTRKLLYESGHELFTTSKNICEFLAVATRGNPPLLSVYQAVNLADEMEQNFTVLYPTPESSQILRGLLRKYHAAGPQVNDFAVVSIGLNHQVNLLGTFDEKYFRGISEIEFARP
ncbi:MAG: PIN domain-containing protein [Verrucomicrobiota bacterium]